MLFSYSLNKAPQIITVQAPEGYKAVLIDYLTQLFGEGLVQTKGKNIVLGETVEKSEFEVTVRENPLLTKLEACLCSKCGDSLEAFEVERKRIFKIGNSSEKRS